MMERLTKRKKEKAKNVKPTLYTSKRHLDICRWRFLFAR
jgi:hypothetical protein